METKDTLQELLDHLEITRWDWLYVGDGSGSNWYDRHKKTKAGAALKKVGGGWACLSLERKTMEWSVSTGACDDATVNFAEAMAYVAPLCRLVSDLHRQRHQFDFKFPTVHVVTDSQYLAGASEHRKDPSANVVLWDAIAAVKRQGVTLVWHYMPRESSWLNRLADWLSKQARTRYLAASTKFKDKEGVDPSLFPPGIAWTGPSKTEPNSDSATSKRTTTRSSPRSSTRPGAPGGSPPSGRTTSRRRPSTSG